MRQVGRRLARLLYATVITLIIVGLGVHWGAFAAVGEDSQALDGPMLSVGAVDDSVEEVEGPTTDFDKALELPHRDLDRTGALELLQGVFAAELQAPAGPFDELQIEKFLASNVAVISAGEQPETAEAGPEESLEEPTLIHSTIPLRLETASGSKETIDLGLEHTDGELQPANPLIEVGLPLDIGDGISLPETNVRISLAAAPGEISPTTIGGSAAFYPNVAQNTDLVIAPTPTGVETFTQIRSADASFVQRFDLELPEEAMLEPTEEGGAIVVSQGEILLEVAPPDALDAAGKQVPVDLEVTESALILETLPAGETQFPILVDPLIQSYKWEAGKYQTGIHVGNTGQEEWSPESVGSFTEYPYCNMCPVYVPSTKQNGQENAHGLYVTSTWYDADKGDHGAWIYTVPRYFKDSELPTSFISNLTLTGLTQWAGSPYKDPYLQAGLWDVVSKKWGSSIIYHEGLEGHNLNDANWVYSMPNPNGNVNNKVASVGLWATQDTPNGPGNVRVLSATVELAEPTEKNTPGFNSISPPSEWMDQTAIPIDLAVQDTGLGVYLLTATSGQKTWKTSHGCTGVGGSACPRIWAPNLKYEPSQLPQGVNTLKVTAEDPLGHVSPAATVPIKVDHTAPSLSISGPLTEVAGVGESWPSYYLDIEASDGTKTAPQSGIAKTVVKVDGKVVNEVALGCETQSCGSYRRWTLEADQFAAGKHTLDVTAVDGVGLSTTKSRTFKLQPAPPPDLSLAGSLTEQEALGASRPRYSLEIAASTEAGQKYEAPAPIAVFGFGKGQVGEPTDVAVDSKGNAWVPRPSESVIKQFDRVGKYIKQIGKYSATGCGLNNPRDIAIDSADNIWVANENGRIVKYNQKGECLVVFGGTGQGEASIGNASCIGITPGGSVWACDSGSGQVAKFSASGQYLGRFGSKGSEKGQFYSPNDIAFGPSGEAWVSDAKRVQKFSATGQFLVQLSENGWGNGEFHGPSGLAIDTEGNLFVVETSNNRVEEFNSEGEYRSHFGYYGTGLGQLYWPTGIAIDSNGDFWIADTQNGRIQKWIAPPRPLEPTLEVGETGSGNGQLDSPAGIATDPEGNHWVVDTANDRIQKFGPEGEYLHQFGETGAGEGQLEEPHDIAFDAEGNIWVTDSGNGRIVHFTTDGEYLGEAEWFLGGYLTGIAIDDEETIWVADATSGLVAMFGPEGELYWWIGKQGSASGQLDEPQGLDVDREGNIWVADAGNNRVEKFDAAGNYLGEIGYKGSGRGELYRPLDVTIDADGNIWVSSSEGWNVTEFTPQGDYLNRFGSVVGEYEMNQPDGVAVDPDGDVWVVVAGGDVLQEWRTPGAPASVSVSVGSEGTGAGQFSSPAGIATDAEGNHWVVDTANNRIQKFGPEGEFLDQFGEAGSGASQLKAPHGVAVDAEGTLWVTDSGNGRIKHFAPNGDYLGQAEYISNVTPGYPTGIAIDPEGTIWVTDIGKGRVVKFGPEGEFYWEWIGSQGSGKGQLSFPFGVAVDPEGNIWVADTYNNRLQKFGQAGQYLGEFGKEGSGEGSLSHPLGVVVDGDGNVWAADSSNGRVKAFDSDGKFLARFGPGNGESHLGEPFGISPGSDGRIWVVDRQNDQMQAWMPSPANGSTSEISTEVRIDGEEVYENTASCVSSSCTLDPEWLFDASAYEEGAHLLEVKATDAFGRTTSEELEVEVEPDKVKPTIEMDGELFNRPEGWVEQENYGVNVSATDAGYGVTSLALKVDGEEVASSTSTCPDGGCKASVAKPINMSVYAGGAHPVEVVAKDGAGNTATKTWTVNVDPDGHVSAAEAIDTLEAVDATSDSTIVAPTSEVLEPGQMEAGDNPSLVVDGAKLESEGVPNTTSLTTEPDDGFTIQSPEGETTIKPIVGEGSSETKVAAGVAGVSTNTNNSVDTIIRPVYNGAQTFKAIRSPTSPEEYSWTVKLAKGQKLESIDSEFAKVVYEDGSMAFLIAAEGAHDATGITVPTYLSVTGSVLTLKVDFKSGQFTFPIIAGQGWETKYEVPTYVELPEDEFEIKQREHEEKLFEEGSGAGPANPAKAPVSPKIGQLLIREKTKSPQGIAAPPYPPSGGAEASRIRVFTVRELKVCGMHCDHWWANLRNPSFIRGSNWAHWEGGTEVHCSTGQAWWFSPVVGVSMPDDGCGFTGPSKVWRNQGKHLTIWGRYRVSALVATEWAEWEEVNFLSLQIWVWPNGFQQNEIGHWDCENSNVEPPWYC